MGRIRVTAEFVYTLDTEPERNGFLEYDDSDGRLISI